MTDVCILNLDLWSNIHFIIVNAIFFFEVVDTEEMDSGLKFLALLDDLGSVSSTTILGDLTPSSDLSRHQACTWYTGTHAGTILT